MKQPASPLAGEAGQPEAGRVRGPRVIPPKAAIQYASPLAGEAGQPTGWPGEGGPVSFLRKHQSSTPLPWREGLASRQAVAG